MPLKHENSNIYKGLTIGLGAFLLIVVTLFVALAAITEKSGRTAFAPPKPAAVAAEKPTAKPQPTVDRSAEIARDHLDAFRSKLRSIDTDGDIVVAVSQGIMPSQAKITVSNRWHYEPYQIRLQTAQGLWNAWANIHSPGEPDKASIKIVDLRDNEVGGSRMLAGSLIWVDE